MRSPKVHSIYTVSVFSGFRSLLLNVNVANTPAGHCVYREHHRSEHRRSSRMSSEGCSSRTSLSDAGDWETNDLSDEQLLERRKHDYKNVQTSTYRLLISLCSLSAAHRKMDVYDCKLRRGHSFSSHSRRHRDSCSMTKMPRDV